MRSESKRLLCIFEKIRTILWVHLGSRFLPRRGCMEDGDVGGLCVWAPCPWAPPPPLASVAPKLQVHLRLGSQDKVPALLSLVSCPPPALQAPFPAFDFCTYPTPIPSTFPALTDMYTHAPHRTDGGGLLPAIADVSSSLGVLSPIPSSSTPPKGKGAPASAPPSHPAAPPSVQVWGISCDDRAMYFRQGVTPSELSGKTWKAIVAGRESDRSHSGSSLSLLR